MAGGFSVTVGVADKFTKPLDDLNKKLAGISAPVKRLNASVQKFGDVSGITKLSGGISKAVSGFENLAKHVVRVVAPLGIISSGASIAGLIAMTEAFGKFGSQLNFNAQNIGISVDRLHALSGAARMAGVSGESAAASLLNLSQTITDAAGGRNIQALGYFRQLGINIRDGVTGNLRGADAVLEDVYLGLEKISNPALQRRVAAALGLSDDQLRIARRGAAGRREDIALAVRYGVVNQAGADAAEKMRRSVDGLGIATEGLGYSIAEKLEPVLSPMLTQMAEWVAKKGPDFAKTVGDIAQRFKLWADNGGMDWIVDKLEHAGNAALVAGEYMLKFLEYLDRLGDHSATSDPLNPFMLHDDPLAPRGTPPEVRSLKNWYQDHGTPNPDISQFSSAQKMQSQLMAKGWTAEQASGIIANIQRESGFDPSRTGDSGQAYGIGQWHPDRQAAFKAWAGHDIRGSSLEEQTDFINHELTAGGEHAAGDILRSTRTATDAGGAISRYYERPHDPDGQEANARSGLAKGWQSRLDTGIPYPGLPNPPLSGPDRMGGTVKTEIILRNAPPGTSMTTTTTGNVQATGRVETSSLLAPH